MTRRIAARTLVTLFTTTLAASISATAQVGGASCSLARAAGTYGVSDSGTILNVGPRAAVALLTLDASGNIKGNVTASVNGVVSSTTLSGTYSVHPDCTGETTFGEFDGSGNLLITATAALVWDHNMREFRFLFTSVAQPDGSPLPTVINGIGTKIVP